MKAPTGISRSATGIRASSIASLTSSCAAKSNWSASRTNPTRMPPRLPPCATALPMPAPDYKPPSPRLRPELSCPPPNHNPASLPLTRSHSATTILSPRRRSDRRSVPPYGPSWQRHSITVIAYSKLVAGRASTHVLWPSAVCKCSGLRQLRTDDCGNDAQSSGKRAAAPRAAASASRRGHLQFAAGRIVRWRFLKLWRAELR